MGLILIHELNVERWPPSPRSIIHLMIWYSKSIDSLLLPCSEIYPDSTPVNKKPQSSLGISSNSLINYWSQVGIRSMQRDDNYSGGAGFRILPRLAMPEETPWNCAASGWARNLTYAVLLDFASLGQILWNSTISGFASGYKRAANSSSNHQSWSRLKNLPI